MITCEKVAWDGLNVSCDRPIDAAVYKNKSMICEDVKTGRDGWNHIEGVVELHWVWKD